MRIPMALLLLLAMLSIAFSEQAKKSPGEEVDVEQAALDLIKSAYPPPLNGRIQVTIDNVAPLEIWRTKDAKKLGGAILTFRVGVKNTGEKEFGFVPGNIDVRLMDARGIELPFRDIRWNQAAHGNSGTYPIAKGEQNHRPIRLVFADDKISGESKYFVVASYVVVYDKPVPKYDFVMAVKPIDMKGAKEKKLDEQE